MMAFQMHTCTAASKLSLSMLLRSVYSAEIPEIRVDPSTLYGRRYLSLATRRFSSLSHHYSSHSPGIEPTSRDPLATEPTTPLHGSKPRDEKKSNASSEKRSESKHRKGGKAAGPVKQQEKKRKPEQWRNQKEALKNKFKEGWNPMKKLSPDALEGIRHLHAMAPDKFTTPVLAQEFKVSPEAIRRILKSKWRPSEEDMEYRRERWLRRSDRIWSQMVELGIRPPKPVRTDYVSDLNVLYGKEKKPWR